MKGGTEGYLQDISQRVEEEKTGDTARRNNNTQLHNKSKKIQTKRNLKIFVRRLPTRALTRRTNRYI